MLKFQYLKFNSLNLHKIENKLSGIGIKESAKTLLVTIKNGKNTLENFSHFSSQRKFFRA